MHTAALLIELGAVIFGLGLVGRLAGRLGISPVPLYLLAGLAFGAGGVVPLNAPDAFLEAASQIGVVMLLLLLGLEYSAGDLLGNLRRQAPVGVLDLLLNGLPGAAFGLLLGFGPVGALAMFGITAVSSSGIVAKVLADLGRLGNRETPSILGILVLEDLGMAVYLPILTAVLAASGVWEATGSVLIALACLAVALVVALRWGSVISKFVSGGSGEVTLLRVLGLALLVAGVAEQLHVSAAVGAFLLGISLSNDLEEETHHRLEPLRDLFAAVFFVSFGLSTDPSSLPPVLLPALGLVVVGVLTKLVTGWVAAKRAGIAVPGRIRAGAALIPRGEFSIVIAGLATAAGVDPQLAALAAAYVLAMAVLGPVLARFADPWARAYVRRQRERAATTVR
ncbi:CPA2 family monovalent cation:H+ antiporter-2 [Kineococcus radiotolerans]|uniref:Sodium/hydrogen exchanger n=2 Tax=Kineococcus radiotolerans TaxID=131568 RepID=A6W6G7_KINRD|nr:cation:proton antiporter [Kineococcus radiotolerans]ABS02406.1 sodium/hydrogen exchanger [Kineococcus radiotolerans SRS30216 = ATCC BAA-149]MBB2900402.1 CPA2 family monovalent cation:H+ antiporter-2 [Kineococcus radiotolerans]